MVISLALLVCLAFACERRSQEVGKESKADIEADVTAIKALINKWGQLSDADDIDGIMSVFYAENSILMPPNESIYKGKEAIRLLYQEYRKSNKDHYDSSVVEDVRVSGDLAVARGMDTGITTPRSGGEAVKFNQKWLMVFERQSDGAWKCISEMWNENPAQTESVEQELIKLEKAWNDALVNHDWALVDQILADDYLTTDSDGVVADKAQEMVILRTGEEAVTSWEADDFMVRVYGDTAVVTYRWTYKGQIRGKASAGQERYTDTWARRDGRWQVVAVHASRIARK